MSFQIGDLVFVHRNAQTTTTSLTGRIGHVKHIINVEIEKIGVEFTDPVGGHDLKGHCLSPYGYYMTAGDITKMEPVSTAFQNYWVKEWEPKLRKNSMNIDSIILLED